MQLDVVSAVRAMEKRRDVEMSMYLQLTGEDPILALGGALVGFGGAILSPVIIVGQAVGDLDDAIFGASSTNCICSRVIASRSVMWSHPNATLGYLCHGPQILPTSLLIKPPEPCGVLQRP